jgi:hypothetical protein
MSEEELNVNVNDLVVIPKAGMSDELKEKCDGARAIIKSCTTEMSETRWVNGQELPDGQTESVPVVMVETGPVMVAGEILKDDLGTEVTIKEKFNLKKHPTTGKWGVSLHEKSKSAQLFNKLKVNSFPECVGKEVILLKKIAPTSGRAYVGFGI